MLTVIWITLSRTRDQGLEAGDRKAAHNERVKKSMSSEVKTNEGHPCDKIPVAWDPRREQGTECRVVLWAVITFLS